MQKVAASDPIFGGKTRPMRQLVEGREWSGRSAEEELTVAVAALPWAGHVVGVERKLKKQKRFYASGCGVASCRLVALSKCFFLFFLFFLSFFQLFYLFFLYMIFVLSFILSLMTQRWRPGSAWHGAWLALKGKLKRKKKKRRTLRRRLSRVAKFSLSVSRNARGDCYTSLFATQPPTPPPPPAPQSCFFCPRHCLS